MTATADVATLTAALDAEPWNQNIRRALADALADAGDERAEGIGALAACNRVPLKTSYSFIFIAREGIAFEGVASPDRIKLAVLPEDWLLCVTQNGRLRSQSRRTRRKLEWRMARAFLRLPDTRRAELLAGRM